MVVLELSLDELEQELLAPGGAVEADGDLDDGAGDVLGGDGDDFGHVWCSPLNGDGLEVLRPLVEQALELRVADKVDPGRGHNNRPASHGGHSDMRECPLVPRNDAAAM